MIKAETELTPVSVPVSSSSREAEVIDAAEPTLGSLRSDQAVNGENITGNSEPLDSQPEYTTNSVDLPALCNSLKEPLPPGLEAKDISEAAQKLVNTLNDKRKHDTLLIEEFRRAMEGQVQAAVRELEQRLFQTYESQKSLLENKLHEMFACLDRIAATEVELVNFRQSLSMLYQEMYSTE